MRGEHKRIPLGPADAVIETLVAGPRVPELRTELAGSLVFEPPFPAVHCGDCMCMRVRVGEFPLGRLSRCCSISPTLGTLCFDCRRPPIYAKGFALAVFWSYYTRLCLCQQISFWVCRRGRVCGRSVRSAVRTGWFCLDQTSLHLMGCWECQRGQAGQFLLFFLVQIHGQDWDLRRVCQGRLCLTP